MHTYGNPQHPVQIPTIFQIFSCKTLNVHFNIFYLGFPRHMNVVTVILACESFVWLYFANVIKFIA